MDGSEQDQDGEEMDVEDVAWREREDQAWAETWHELRMTPAEVFARAVEQHQKAPYVLMTYLNPVEIPAGEAVMMLAPDQFEHVERIPDWYWTVEERQLGFTMSGLVGNQILGTYFTCRRTADGMMFKTVLANPSSQEYVVMAQTRTHAEALAAHAHWQQLMSVDPTISGTDP